MSKFKIGDRVKMLTSEQWWDKGEEGKVIGICEDGTVNVYFPKQDDTWHVEEYDFELLEENGIVMSKFKVGDRVVCKDFGSGTVVKVREYDYTVKFDKPHAHFHLGDMGDGLRQYWFCGETELLSENIAETDLESDIKENPEDTCVMGRSLPTGFSFTLDIDNRMETGEYCITNELGVYKVHVIKLE